MENKNYRYYFATVDGMKYDPACSEGLGGFVYPAGYPEEDYSNLDYDLQYSYAKITDEITEPVTTELLGAAPKDVGKYIVKVKVPESPEYEESDPVNIN